MSLVQQLLVLRVRILLGAEMHPERLRQVSSALFSDLVLQSGRSISVFRLCHHVVSFTILRHMVKLVNVESVVGLTF